MIVLVFVRVHRHLTISSVLKGQSHEN
jgi:hypothetical protein